MNRPRTEEALSELTRVKSSVAAPDAAREVDQYRAFCLVALGRTAEAEQLAESLVRKDPMMSVDASRCLSTHRGGVRGGPQTRAAAGHSRRIPDRAIAGESEVAGRRAAPDAGASDADRGGEDRRMGRDAVPICGRSSMGSWSCPRSGERFAAAPGQRLQKQWTRSRRRRPNLRPCTSRVTPTWCRRSR